MSQLYGWLIGRITSCPSSKAFLGKPGDEAYIVRVLHRTSIEW